MKHHGRIIDQVKHHSRIIDQVKHHGRIIELGNYYSRLIDQVCQDMPLVPTFHFTSDFK